MVTKIFTVLAYVVAAGSIVGAYSQASALHLRQTNQPLYRPRYRMTHFGSYRSGQFQPLSTRSGYGGFRGGGTSSGK